MFGGGIPAATMMALVGPSGSGKSTLGLHFLSGSSADEPGLLFGCYEPPERLRLKAATMGFDLAAAEQRGDVELLWFPVGEHVFDELAHRLLDAVRRRGVRRLVIDGVSGFQQAALEPVARRGGRGGRPRRDEERVRAAVRREVRAHLREEMAFHTRRENLASDV